MVEESTVEASTHSMPSRQSLTSTDRCDRCGAQAYVRVLLHGGELLFCGHHFGRFDDSLRAVADYIDDQTDLLHTPPF